MDLPGIVEVNRGLGTGDDDDESGSFDDESSGTPEASAPTTNLWDVSAAPTIVMTQRGARPRFQAGGLLRTSTRPSLSLIPLLCCISVGLY
jgi:hypothetical protein